MAVSKRTRFEVLRRDTHPCRYCRSTDNPLTVDHVTPVSLGGSDDPSNLVAACRDCNYGKASSAPDAEPIAKLTDEQIRYERARASVMARHEEAARAKHEDHERFLDAWLSALPNSELPDDWRSGVTTWMGRGLSVHRLIEAVHLTAGRKHVPTWAKYAYMAKIAWNWVTELEEEIKAELASEDGEAAADEWTEDGVHLASYSAGVDDMYPVGVDRGHHDAHVKHKAAILSDRILSLVVDGLTHDLPRGLKYDPEPIV